MEKKQSNINEVIEVCLLAGRIMLQNGAETYRVEDTMTRISSSFGIEASHSYVTPTVIMFSAEKNGPPITKLIRISDRTTDLQKVAMVNSVSRRISNGEVEIEKAMLLLNEIDALYHTFPLIVQTMAACLASGCFMIMFKGDWWDFVPSMVAGGLGFLAVVYLHGLVPIKFFAEFSGALVIGFVSLGFVLIGAGHELDKIIIGSVMSLVPGVLLTNAVRDLMAGHLVSGLSKGAEALLTACAIGSGIAVVLTFI